MNVFKIIGYLFLIICSSSCREIFDDELTGSDTNILVVEGVINNNPGPYKVKLSRSVFFTSDKRVEVTDAEVYVIDDLNNRYDFLEKAPGIYLSDSANFRGQLGRVYTLYINTNDRLKYKSTPCTIGPPSKIDTLYYSGEAFTVGDMIYVDLSFESDQKMSTKIDADIALENLIDYMQVLVFYHNDTIIKIDTIIQNLHKIVKIDTIIKIDIDYDTIHLTKNYSYIIKPLNNIPIIKTNTDYKSGSIIRKIPLFTFYKPFIKSDTTRIDSLNLIVQTSGLNFILIINASTISNETFDYYYNLLTQIKGENTYFEPIPTKLFGNIKCINNSTYDAYGIFQANSITKKYYIFSNVGLKEIRGITPRTYKIIDTHQIDTINYEK
jgi:hypothetical protein